MSEEERKREEDIRRINSINIGTPGHWWGDYKKEKSKVEPEVDPGKFNLNDPRDFLLFLEALGKGDQKALDFLKEIPKDRIAELKKLHSHLEGFFTALDQEID